MRSLTEQPVQYAAYHRDRRNITTRFVGMPMSVLAVRIFLSRPAFAAFGAILSPVIMVAAIVAIFSRLLGGRRPAFNSRPLSPCDLRRGPNLLLDHLNRKHWATVRGQSRYKSCVRARDRLEPAPRIRQSTAWRRRDRATRQVMWAAQRLRAVLRCPPQKRSAAQSSGDPSTKEAN